MTNALHDLSSRLSKAGQDLSGSSMRRVASEVGVAAKRDMDEAARAATGGDGVMSNWPRARLTSGFTIKGSSSLTLAPKPLGAWKVLESGAAAHVVHARKGRVLSTPFGPRPLVRIPHTRGKQAWSKGRRIVEQRTPERIAVIVGGQLRRTLNG